MSLLEVDDAMKVKKRSFASDIEENGRRMSRRRKEGEAGRKRSERSSF